MKIQEHEFERIESLLTNRDISRLPSIIFNQTEEKMELTNQDKKHIEEQVRKLSFRIVDEAKEYMRLYEKTYFEEVIKMCQSRIDAIDYLHEQTLKISNNET